MRIKLKLTSNKLHLNAHTLPFPTAQKLIDTFNAHKLHPFIKDMVSVVHLTYAHKHVTIRREDVKKEDVEVNLALDAKIRRKYAPFIQYERNTMFKRIDEVRAMREKEMDTVYSGMVGHANLIRSVKGRMGNVYVSLVALMDDKCVKLVYRQGTVEDTYVGGFKRVMSVKMQDLKAVFENFTRFYNWKDVKEYMKGEAKHGTEDVVRKTPGSGNVPAKFGELRSGEAVCAPLALTPGLGVHHSGGMGMPIPARQTVPVGAYTPAGQFSSPGQPTLTGIYGAGVPPNYVSATPGFVRVSPSPLKPYDILESHRSEMLKMLNVEKNEAKRKEIYRNLEILEMKRREMFRMADMRRRNYSEPVTTQPVETAKKEPKMTSGTQRTRMRVKERGEHGKDKTNQESRNEPIDQRHGLLVQKGVIMKEGGKSMENEYDEMKRNRRVERGAVSGSVRGGMGMDVRGGGMGEIRNERIDVRGTMNDMRMGEMRDMRGDVRIERPDLRNERMDMRSDRRGERMDMRGDMRMAPDGRMFMDMRGAVDRGMDMRMMDVRMDMRQEGRATPMRMTPEMFTGNPMESRRRMHTPDVMVNVVDGKNTINPRQVLEGGYAPVRGRPKKKVEEKGAHVPVRGRPRTKPRSPVDKGMFSRSEEMRANPPYYTQPRPYTMQPPMGFEMNGNPMSYGQPIKAPGAFKHMMKMPTPSNFNLQNVQNYSPDGVMSMKKDEKDDDKGFGDDAVDMPDFTG